jgi:hypothetical protein
MIKSFFQSLEKYGVDYLLISGDQLRELRATGRLMEEGAPVS